MNRKIKVLIFISSIIIVALGFLISEKISPEKKINETSVDEDNKASNVDDSSKNNTNEADLFEQYYDSADKILNNMTLDEKVGQLFYARYPLGDATSEIINEQPGGYILFAKDFENETKDTFYSKISKNQQSSKIKMFIGVDEEGGTVVRVSKYKSFRESPFLAPQKVYEQGGMELIETDTYEKTNLLLSLGINTNFAPVVDIPTNQYSFMYDRSFGTDPTLTSEYVRRVVDITNRKKFISVLKHFPGYGDNVDTHTGIAIDNRTLDNFKEVDFKPFEAGIETSVPMIMVNHNIISNIDSKYPASLSKEVHDILRNDLNFSGLIITDDLTMEAVSKYTSDGSASVQAIIAGNDMIISSDFKKQKAEVLEAIKNNTISEERINESVRRILACKLAYGIIEE